MSVTFSILADGNRINVVTNDYVHIGDFFSTKGRRSYGCYSVFICFRSLFVWLFYLLFADIATDRIACIAVYLLDAWGVSVEPEI